MLHKEATIKLHDHDVYNQRYNTCKILSYQINNLILNVKKGPGTNNDSIFDIEGQ